MNKLNLLIEKEKKKCIKLDEQYAVYEEKKAEIENSIKTYTQYQIENSYLIQCKEKEAQDLESLKKEFAENKTLIKERNNLLLKQTQIKQEHDSLKQTYDDLLNKKKELELTELQLIEKNSKLKDIINEILHRIDVKEKEKKDLNFALQVRIEQEVKLREYYENSQNEQHTQPKEYLSA